MFSGKPDCIIKCKRCLSSYTSENMIIKHEQHCIQKEKTSIRTPPESHLLWKNHFHKNPLYFWLLADFEADNEKDISSNGDKTTNFYRQNTVCNVHEVVSELEVVLKSGYHKSPLSYENVVWFVDEVIRIEKKWIFTLWILRKIS